MFEAEISLSSSELSALVFVSLLSKYFECLQLIMNRRECHVSVFSGELYVNSQLM